MLSKRQIRNPLAGIGCGYLLKLTIGIISLMIANCYVVGFVVQANIQYFPELLQDVRVIQFAVVGLPFLMVLVQFWIYDRIRDRLTRVERESLRMDFRD